MNWRILATDGSQSDFDRLSDDERAALVDDLFGWVEVGPPRTNRRVVGGLELFEDRVESGFIVTYFVEESAPYIGILRVRGT